MKRNTIIITIAWLAVMWLIMAPVAWIGAKGLQQPWLVVWLVLGVCFTLTVLVPLWLGHVLGPPGVADVQNRPRPIAHGAGVENRLRQSDDEFDRLLDEMSDGADQVLQPSAHR